MVSTDGRWTIRGISDDLQSLVTTRAMIEKKTVGEIVTEALATYLGRPTQLDVTETLLERVNALEARLNQMSAPRPTIVTAERPGKSKGVPPETVALVKKLSAEGKSQRVVSQLAGVATGTVSNILNGKFD